MLTSQASSYGVFFLLFFFFNATATPEIYTLSLHDALPILTTIRAGAGNDSAKGLVKRVRHGDDEADESDRKSTRLNSSHRCISYAVFCLKKKKEFKSQVGEYEK